MALARPAGNFFGPFVSVRFFESDANVSDPIDEDGVVVITPSNLQRQAEIDSRNIQNYLANAVIEFSPGSATLELTLTPPYADALDLLETGILVYQTLVCVRWGYTAGNLFQERLFIINQPKVVFGRDISITLSAVDAFSHSMRQRDSKSKWKRQVYRSDYELLVALANVTGHTINFFGKGAVIPGNRKHSLNVIKVNPIEDCSSDWELFLKICQGNDVVPTVGEKNVITLYDRNTIASEDPTYNFFWYDQPVLANDIPMTSFTVNPTEVIYGPKDAVRKLISHVDADTGKVIFNVYEPATDPSAASAGDPKIDKNIFGTQSMNNQEIITCGNLPIKPKPTMDKARLDANGNPIPEAFSKNESHPQYANNANTKLEMHSQDASLQGNTSAVIVAPGHPDVIPPMGVTVRGVGKLFSGDYYMTSARHTIGTGGYEMQLNIVRTTTHDADNTQTNTKTPDGAPPAMTGAGPDVTSLPGRK